MKNYLAILAFAIAIFFPHIPSMAETVFIRAGTQQGQGWLFKSGVTCWLLTAKHLVLPGTSMVIVGEGGHQGIARAESVVRSIEDDLALARVDEGRLAYDCPADSFGQTSDAEDASFDEIWHGHAAIVIDWRGGKIERGTGVSTGITSIALVLLGRGDIQQERQQGRGQSHTFSMHAANRRSDPAFKGLSGSPILVRGGGVGESGMPLGIQSDVKPDASGDDVIIATRMSVARAFFELESQKLIQKTAPFLTSVRIADTRGITSDTACGPLNMLDHSARCGWRVRRTTDIEPIRVELDLGSVQVVTGVMVRFTTGASSFAVTTTVAPERPSAWVDRRDCAISRRVTQIECSLGERQARVIAVIFYATATEIRELRVETASDKN